MKYFSLLVNKSTGNSVKNIPTWGLYVNGPYFDPEVSEEIRFWSNTDPESFWIEIAVDTAGNIKASFVKDT